MKDVEKLRLRSNPSCFWRVLKRSLKSLAKVLPGYQIRRRLLRAAGYKIGKSVYIGEDLIIIDELDELVYLHIGNMVAMVPRVNLVISSTPNYSRIGLFAPKAYGPIVIEDDVWPGTGAVILPNVTVGQGAIVGALSLVTGDVPPFTIVTGIRAKPYRMSDCPESQLRRV